MALIYSNVTEIHLLSDIGNMSINGGLWFLAGIIIRFVYAVKIYDLKDNRHCKEGGYEAISFLHGRKLLYFVRNDG